MKARTRNSEITRGELIAAGGRQFARHGFDGCRTQVLADEAGVNKAMIQYHFGGKLGLYQAILEDALDRAQPLLEGFDVGACGSGERALKRWIEIMMAVVESVPYLPAILMREHLDGDARLHRLSRDRLDLFSAKTREILEVHRDSLRDEDPGAVHLSLIGALNHFLVTQPVGDVDTRSDRRDRDRYLDHLHRLFARGLAIEGTL